MAPRKPRSPSYPAFDLSQAADKAKKIYDQCGQSPVNREALSSVLGFSPTSGGAKQNIATLTQYGLLERRGQGELGVSTLAVTLLYSETPEQKQSAATEALRAPAVFAELAGKFQHQIPTERILIPTLTQSGFNIGAAEVVAKAYVQSAAWVAEMKEGVGEDMEVSAASVPEAGAHSRLPSGSGKAGDNSGEKEWVKLPVGESGTLVIRTPGNELPDADDVGATLKVLQALATTLPRVCAMEGELLVKGEARRVSDGRRLADGSDGADLLE